MLTDPDYIITSKAEVLAFIGMFLLVIINFELIDILYLYTKTQKIHVEVVLLVGLTAVSRELIVFNYEDNNGALIAGLGVLIAALSVAYFLIRKVYNDYGVNDPRKRLGVSLCPEVIDRIGQLADLLRRDRFYAVVPVWHPVHLLRS